MLKLQEQDVERIRSTAAGLVDKYHLPGMSVGVVSGDDLVFAEGFGFADIESRRPQAPEVPQRIGSITKTFTGLCTMALVDEGKLSLDDRVLDLLPEISFRGPAETLNIWHLLTHTGGIGEAPATTTAYEPVTALWSDESELPPIVEGYADGFDIEAVPGTKWCYANHAFGLLSEIVARAEGSPIEEVMKSRIFDPLGMADTDCYDQPHPGLGTGYFHAPGHDDLDLLELTGRDPVEYETVDGYNIKGPYVYVTPRACGAIQSTIPDMARYASALLRSGAGIVKPETFDAMVGPQYNPDDRMINLGLTFQRIPRFGRRSFGHGGGGGRMYWNAYLSVIPEEDLAVIIHMNFSTDVLNTIASRIIQAALNAPDAAFADSPPTPEILAAAPGVYQVLPGPLTNYRPITSAGRVQITARDGGLFLRSRRGAWRDGLKMLPADPGDPAFFALDNGAAEPPLVALVLDDQRRVKGIRFDRLSYLERNESLEPWG